MDQILSGLRPYKPEDIDRLAALFREAGSWPPGPAPTPEDVLARWQRRHVDPQDTASVLAGPGGELIAYSNAAPFHDGSARFSIEIVVHPDYRRRGLGSALLHLIEERGTLRHVTHLWAQVPLPSGVDRPECTGFLVRRGFERYSGYWQYRIEGQAMHCPAEWPAGIAVRSMDGRALERDAGRWARLINAAFSEPATADSIIAQANEPGSSPLGYFFAVDEKTGQEIGTSRARIDPQGGQPVGYIGTVGVLPAYRRRGIAEALVCHTLAYLAGQGATAATLFVEENNHGAIALYRKLGWRPAFLGTNYWKLLAWSASARE